MRISLNIVSYGMEEQIEQLSLLETIAKKIKKTLSEVPEMNTTVYISRIKSLETGDSCELKPSFHQITQRYPLYVKGKFGRLEMDSQGYYSYQVYHHIEGHVTESFMYTVKEVGKEGENVCNITIKVE